MKISIIIPVLNSHEAVRRQVLYFNSLRLPKDIEFIFVDDGSNPPLRAEDYILDNLTIYHTNDKRPWTQGLARNKGASIAEGKYLFMTDIDHIISKEALDAVYEFKGSKMVFPRHIAILDENGKLTQDLDTLVEYGYDLTRYKRRGYYASVHGNTFAMKKYIFESLQGYSPNACQYGYHAPRKKGEDCYFNRKWNRFALAEGLEAEVGPPIYMFPVGRYNVTGDNNPKGLFHNLSYEPVPQPMLE